MLEAQGETPEPTSPPETKHVFDDDLIPDVLSDRSEEDLDIDRIIDGLDPLLAYRRWIAKEVEEKEVGQEEVHISCPFPNHRDANPSAWILTRDKGSKPKGTWFCGGCQEGGDLYDMAAIHFGYPVPGYKDGKTFHELRKDMAESFGYRFKKVAGKEVIWQEEEASAVADASDKQGDSDPVPTSEPTRTPGSADSSEPSVQASTEPSEVSYINDESVPDDPNELLTYPTINWRAMIPEDTFLWEYMTACTNDDSPEEYHFFHGLLAVAHACGKNVYLDDMKYVYGNMLVCLLGGTGFGKSRSRGWLQVILEEAIPFSDNGLDTTGVKLVPVPASGENLIYQFQHIAYDPTTRKPFPVEVRTSVNGIVDYDEFAGLLTRAGRQGSTLKPILQNFADNASRVSSSSMTGGTYEAHKPFCSITASTQPKAVRTLLSRYDTGSGFLNRWVFVGGPRKKRESIGGKRSGIRVDLTQAVDELKFIHSWSGTERSVEMTDEGYAEWDDWFHKVIEPMQLNDETDLLSRLGLTMKRMLLLLAANEKKTQITAEDIKRAKPLLDYLVRCYGVINTEIGVTAMTEITSEILRHIKNIEEKTGRGATARDLGLRMKRKNYSPDLIKKALETMVALDWIDIEKQRGPGRPSIRYKVVV